TWVFARYLRESAIDGVVVNVTAMAGLLPGRGREVYGAAKAGLIHFTEASKALSPRIRVCALAPYYTDHPPGEHENERLLPGHRLGAVLLAMSSRQVVASVIRCIEDPRMAGQTLLVNGSSSYSHSWATLLSHIQMVFIVLWGLLVLFAKRMLAILCPTTPIQMDAAAAAAVVVGKDISKGLSVDSYEPKAMTRAEFQLLPRKQQKRIMKQELWDNRADEFKEKQRQKNRDTRRRRKERIREGEAPPRRKPEDQTRTAHRFVIDMDFDDKMDDREIKSMCSQVQRCYAANRQAAHYVGLHVTRLHGQCRRRFDTALAQHAGWSSEHIVLEDKEYPDLFPAEHLVYLTADSPNVIESLDATKVYVIGGIVDKNRYPRLTLDKAEQQGIQHAQLPIGRYVQMSTRKVMTVNQIFEMLLRFIDVNDWKTAFLD
ncbi:tRNA methyltransferase 10, partial [Coemansia sp. RSA 25]